MRTVEKNLMQTLASQLSSSLHYRFIIVFCLNFKEQASLHDWVGEPSNGDKTSEYETQVENEQQRPGNETVARLDREFCNDVANKSEDTSAEGQ